MENKDIEERLEIHNKMLEELKSITCAKEFEEFIKHQTESYKDIKSKL